jgi:GTP diphosphokinase / guanosine-3',5'-bis(diphosphate) 3'-diphosphatase
MAASSLGAVLAALDFAALKHRDQRRKDANASPYINHLITVTRILADEGAVTDESVLVAAALARRRRGHRNDL